MPWTFKEMIKSIFKKTRADIASEKRQRVEADNNIMQQLNTAVNGGLANKVDKLSEDEITVSNAKNSESHNLTLNNNIAMLSYRDSLNNESQVVVSTTGIRLKEKSNINNNVTVSSTKSEVSHTDKVLLKAGDNVLQVDATDGLQISTDGGSTWGAVGGHLYEHNITFIKTSTNDNKVLAFTLINNSETPLTKSTSAALLYGRGLTSQNASMKITGITWGNDVTTKFFVSNIYSENGSDLKVNTYRINSSASGSGTLGTGGTFTDTVVQIM